MTERKSDAVNFRMVPSTKELLRLAAGREHRTLSNMLGVFILEQAAKAGIELAVAKRRTLMKPTRPQSEYVARAPSNAQREAGPRLEDHGHATDGSGVASSEPRMSQDRSRAVDDH